MEAERKRLKLDPRTKVLILAFIATIEMFDISIYVICAIGLIPFALLLSDGRIAGAFKYMTVFALSVLAHIFRTDMQINMVLNMVVVLLGGFVLKLFPSFACGEYILKSTSVSEMMSAFTAMGISRNILIPLSVMFRFFPTIKEEHDAIGDAARMRGMTADRRKFWKNPGRAFEYRVIPLMISIANIGNDLSAAALSKGIDNPVRHTAYADVKIKSTDIATVIILMIFITASFALPLWV